MPMIIKMLETSIKIISKSFFFLRPTLNLFFSIKIKTHFINFQPICFLMVLLKSKTSNNRNPNLMCSSEEAARETMVLNKILIKLNFRESKAVRLFIA